MGTAGPVDISAGRDLPDLEDRSPTAAASSSAGRMDPFSGFHDTEKGHEGHIPMKRSSPPGRLQTRDSGSGFSVQEFNKVPI